MPDAGRIARGSGTATPSLTRWGLSASADLVYRALSACGDATPEELAATLGLPGRRVRESLEELEAIGGSAVETLGDSRWRAAAPATVTVALRRRHRQMVSSAQALQRRMTTRAGGLAIGEGDLAAAFGTTIRPLFGSTRIRSRLGELVAAERCEYLAMIPEPAFDQRAVKAAAPLNRLLCERGVVFSLGVPPTTEDRCGAHTEELVAMGMQYRELPTLPTKLFIIDRTTAITSIDPSDTGKGFWEITAPEVVHRLLELYMRRWQQGIAPRKRWTPPMTLTPRERAILSLMAEGHTDETVALRLGLSRRTIAYTVADLMERHGARNRFQLGLFLSDLDTPSTSADPDPLSEPEPETETEALDAEPGDEEER